MKLRFYPLVLAILWIFPTINRFFPYIFDYDKEWTYIAHIFCESLLGLANLLILALNPKNKRQLPEKLINEKWDLERDNDGSLGTRDRTEEDNRINLNEQ